MRARTRTVMAGALLGAHLGLAQGLPFTGPPAPISLKASTSTILAGATVDTTLSVDLAALTGTCQATAMPVVLGGYAIGIRFEPSRLRFVRATTCGTTPFAAPPTTTTVAAANATGLVTLASNHTDPTAPTGKVCVATLTFQALLVTGNANLTPDATTASLSSAFTSCTPSGTAGPAPIPAQASAETITIIVTPVELQRFTAE